MTDITPSTAAPIQVILDARDARTDENNERDCRDDARCVCVEREERGENEANTSRVFNVFRGKTRQLVSSLELSPTNVGTAPKLPQLVPLENYGQYTLLDALKEETKIEDSEKIYKETQDAVV